MQSTRKIAMIPKVVMHNQISLDGSLLDFEMNLELHYQIVSRYQADLHLIGSLTVKHGIELFLEKRVPEEAADFLKPDIQSDDTRPYWAIVDSKGSLINQLHMIRKSGYCKDIILLVSESTPRKYLDYLTERHYDYIMVGKDHVDYRKALAILSERYSVKTVLTDTGETLNSILLKEGLIDEISLLICPELVGKKRLHFVQSLKAKHHVKLALIQSETFDNKYVLLHYHVIK
jgi:2,5-diamino-6-(ribosylamino)-4(3H)-pyrimidinone 5'-phosphate reductase